MLLSPAAVGSASVCSSTAAHMHYRWDAPIADEQILMRKNTRAAAVQLCAQVGARSGAGATLLVLAMRLCGPTVHRSRVMSRSRPHY